MRYGAAMAQSGVATMPNATYLLLPVSCAMSIPVPTQRRMPAARPAGSYSVAAQVASVAQRNKAARALIGATLARLRPAVSPMAMWSC